MNTEPKHCFIAVLRIRITLILIQIRLITLMRIRIMIFIWCGCGSGFLKWCGSGSTTLFYITNDILFLMIAGRRWSSRRQTPPPAWLTCPSSPPVSPQRPGGRGSCSPPLSRWQDIASVRRGYFAVLWIRIRVGSGFNVVPALLRIRDVYSGSRILIFYPFLIPYPNTSTREGWKQICCHTFICSHKFHKIENYFIFETLKKQIWPGFQRIIELSKFSQSLKNMGLGSGIRNKPIPDPGSGSRGQKGIESRIRIRNTGSLNPDPDPGGQKLPTNIEKR